MAVKLDEAEALRAQLRGQTIILPDLVSWFSNWPSDESEHREELRLFMDKSTESVISDEKKIRGVKKCDFAWFTALWYREASWTDLQTAALFVLWIFVWDDEIDTGESAVSTDLKVAKTYRQESLEYARWCLAQQDSNVPWPLAKLPFVSRIYLKVRRIFCRSKIDEPPPCSVSSMQLFREWAFTLRTHMNEDQLARLFGQVKRYITHCGHEQEERSVGRVPTPDEYMELRMGTSGVEIACAFHEYFIKSHLPRWLMNSPEMKNLWRLTNILLVILNDVLSVKKEITEGNIISLIPVNFHANGNSDLNRVVEETLKDLEVQMDAFDKTADKLDELTADGPFNKHTMQFVRYCRRSVTGTLTFTMLSDRYRVKEYLREDGTMHIVL
ncbi:isoprenoid synthase domain-containing protein [Dactylonectria estremocensis]|uniref:Terpene synthase n=1 Tax=Dactylonectria estremocensis TaxID=1079267 RepID=A0A9P9EP13_9HYPO|nr:isoprenoid synthase domain-containing protein [Dactylonectria estremocensis]